MQDDLAFDHAAQTSVPPSLASFAIGCAWNQKWSRIARDFLVPFLGWKISPEERVCVSTVGSARCVRWIKSINAPTLPNLFEATIIHLYFRFMRFTPTHPWFPPPFNVWETPRIEVRGSHGIHDVFLAKLMLVMVGDFVWLCVTLVFFFDDTFVSFNLMKSNKLATVADVRRILSVRHLMSIFGSKL